MKKLENIEAEIKEIFIDLFGVEDIEYEDNFFDLEFNSLLATQLLYRIKQEFQSNLSLQELFDKPTIKQLAEYIIEEQETNNAKSETSDAADSEDNNIEDVVEQLSNAEMNDLFKKLSEE